MGDERYKIKVFDEKSKSVDLETFLNSSEVDRVVSVMPVTQTRKTFCKRYHSVGHAHNHWFEDEELAHYTHVWVVYVPSEKKE